MAARPDINEFIPSDKTGYGVYDHASYINNKNTRPIKPYNRERRYTSCIWHKGPNSDKRSYYAAYSPPLRNTTVRNSLIAKCKANCFASIDMIMLTRDLKEAVHGTTSFMLKVPRTMRLLKSGRFSEAARCLGYRGRKSIPNTYLAYTYAVSPLVSDIAHLWEFATEKKPPVVKLAQAASATKVTRQETSLTSYVQEKLSVAYENKSTHSVRMVRYFSSDAFLDLEGLSLNPIPTIWDAIPYSFVVDWFIPVSDALKMITYSGVRPVGGYNCYRVVSESSVTFPSGVISRDPKKPQLYHEYGTGLPKSESFYFERTVDNSLTWTLPEASAAFKSSAKLSLRRLLNAFMMAWQSTL